MKWLKFRIETTEEAEDILISDLYDCGLEGAQIEDKRPLTALEKEQMFVDIMPETEADDGIAYLSFFKESPEDEKEKDLIVLENIISLAHRLGIICLAEGAETAPQVDRLRELGCEIVQGYYYSKPIPMEEYDGAPLVSSEEKYER